MLKSTRCKLALGLAGVAFASASAAADSYMGRRGYYGYAPPASYGYVPPRAYGYAPPRAYGFAPPGAYGYAPPGAYGYAPPGAYGYAPPGAYGYAPPGAYGYAPPGAYGNTLLPAYGYNPADYTYYTSPALRTPPSNPYYFGTEAWWRYQELIGHD
jgi:hypothetical protein